MKPTIQRTFAALCLGLPMLTAWAQYKVVQPDGRVTYTDRPSADGGARITTLGRNGAAAPAADAGFPIELRQAMQRYPVTLYTSADCTPCDNGRRLLQTRGVPYSERRVASEEDAQALERTVGARTVPALTVGVQPLRGLSETDWLAYLDAAGYPRESRLPRGWQPPPPLPVVERVVPTARASPVVPVLPSAEALTDPGTPGSVRF